MLLVAGRELGPDAGLALRHDGEEEPDRVDALLVESPGEVPGQLGVEEHDRDDRSVALAQDETGLLQALAPVGRVPLQLVAPLGRGVQNLEDLEHTGHDHGGDGVGEEVGPGFLAAHLDQLLAARDAASGRPAQALAVGRGDDVDLAQDAVLFVRSAAGLADEPRGVRIVDQQHGVVLFAQGDHLVQRGGVAVHGEDAVGDDQAVAPVLVHLQLLLQVGHVGVLEGVLHGRAEADAVDERGVDQAVRDHDVVLGQDGLEDAGVGVHAGGEEDGVLGAQESGGDALQLAMDVLRAADEADRGHAVAPAVQARVGGLDHLGVAGQPKVIIGAHVDDRLDRGAGGELDLDVGRLGGVDEPLLLE